MKIEIRKAKKDDFEDYYKLKKLECEENTLLIGEVVKIPKRLKQDFLNSLLSKKETIMFARINKIVGYVRFSLFNNFLYLDDIFVKKEFRKKGIATQLIKELFKIAKRKNLKNVRLGVLIDNKEAIKLYNKIGFRNKRYEMEKKLK